VDNRPYEEQVSTDWDAQQEPEPEPGALRVPQMSQAQGSAPAEPPEPREPGAASTPSAASGPAAAASPPAAAPPQPAAGELSGTAALSADVRAAWATLDPTAKLLVNASAAAIILTVVGLPLSVWDSANFGLLILTAGVIALVTAWFGEQPAMRTVPIPRSTIELVVAVVAAILAVMKAIEVLFDFDTDGIVGLVVAVALVAATVVMVIAATRRGADLRAAITGGDQGAKLALGGLALVLLGWAFNLSISFWTMGQAALPLAVLTIAALTIAEAPRMQSPIPVAWVGAAIAIFGALLVLGNWNELLTLGRTDLELDPGHFIGILAYTIGTILIIVGGVLSGRGQWTPPEGAEVQSE
jgi:hypothetical protein